MACLLLFGCATDDVARELTNSPSLEFGDLGEADAAELLRFGIVLPPDAGKIHSKLERGWDGHFLFVSFEVPNDVDLPTFGRLDQRRHDEQSVAASIQSYGDVADWWDPTSGVPLATSRETVSSGRYVRRTERLILQLPHGRRRILVAAFEDPRRSVSGSDGDETANGRAIPLK